MKRFLVYLLTICLILNLLPLGSLCSIAAGEDIPLEAEETTPISTDSGYSPEVTPSPIDTGSSQITPTPVETGSPEESPAVSPYGWKKIFTNANISIGILDDDSLWQWYNNNSFNQEAPESDESEPINDPIVIPTSPVKMLESVADVSIGAGGNILALTSDKKLWSWGSNQYGQIGDGTMTYRPKPVSVMDDVYKIYADDYSHCYAIKNDLTLWGWGDSIDGESEPSTTPQKLTDNVVDVTGGPCFVLMLKAEHSLWGLGYNSSGVLGNNPDIVSNIPVKLMDDVKKIKVRNYTCYAIKKDNSLWTWGEKQYVQLEGDEISDIKNLPSKVLDDVADVVVATNSSYALKSDGSVYSWGSNYNGELGRLTETFPDAPGLVMDNIKELSSTDSHVLALDNNGSLYGWGSNWSFQLGRDESSEGGESYIMHSPILLADNVSSFATTYNTSSYINTSGELLMLGQINGSYYEDPLYIPVEPFISSTFLKDNMIEIYMAGINAESVNREDFSVNSIINGVPQAVTFDIYGVDKSSNAVTLQVPEVTPSDKDTKVAYSLSYRGNIDINTNEILIPSNATPTPPSTATPTPPSTVTPTPSPTATPTSSSTATPTPYSIIYNSATSYPAAASPESSDTPVPSFTIAPSNTPEPPPILSAADYNKKLDDFKSEITKLADQYKGTSDIYGDMNEALIKKAEKAIEDISLRRVNPVGDKVEINKNLILPQSQIVKEAKSDIEKILKDYITEDIRDIRTRINVLVDGIHNKINLNCDKDIIGIMKEKVDVRISTNLGNVILFNKYAENQLNDNMTITLTESKKTSLDIKNIKSSRINLKFTSPRLGTIKKISGKIGYELPYGDGDPEYSTMLHESDDNFYNMGGHEDLDYKVLQISTAFSGDYIIVEDKKSFQDIGKENSEMKKAVEVLASKGIISGRNNNSFDPNASINRSEFTSLIVKGLNLIDVDAACDFKDVLKTAWYYNMVSIASSEGIIDGYEDKTFRGSRIINAQEIVKICAATLNERAGYYYPKNLDKYLNFADKNSIPQWVRKYAALGSREGLIVKKPDNCFNGVGSCTRGDAAIIMYRLYKKM
ncbi:S-layer homology domain-containing protein [Pseudobacteroides cellulosolvens]|uniref:S-layer domain-containing protein n=1 Tax=Pseudobacteroides cellulosolvens ATCC 35603 = DSM 2933 TaxID=398512 RepID=A0A0L6JW41_9FIRM|nr:S-layer homology domain-containing protein [Pseudobacteroides cellulosolvens]KNY29944.1 S-layer domain-containing protein [Pseudobacteroides cellulosolvens ATCC 35603 = DSM 2933]